MQNAADPPLALGLSRDRPIDKAEHLRKRHAGFPVVYRILPQGARDDG